MEIDARSVPASAIPAAFLEIAWHRFFRERGRGISLDVHFPWLRRRDRRQRAVLVTCNGQPAGMLIVRLGGLDRPERRLTVAGIGLVCTAKGMEGKGVAGTAMHHALQLARDAGADCALLWTRQHEFYRRLGFTLADRSILVTAERPRGLPRSNMGCLTLRRLEHSPLRHGAVFAGQRGVPPFAREVYVLGQGSVGVAMVMGTQTTLVSSAGPASAVAAMLGGLWLDRLQANDHPAIGLSGALDEAGWSTERKKVELSMWARISGSCPDADEIANLPIHLLDRF